MASTALARWAGPAAILGGLLWAPYGFFEMLEPWGAAKIYQGQFQGEVVTNTPLFLIYSLPGSLALLLTALGLLGVIRSGGLPASRLGKGGVVLAYLAAGLGVLSALGVVTQFVPLFVASLVFGSLFLGAASLVVGIDARRAGAASRWTVALVILGMMGLFLFSLRPLVYALEWLPEAAGAAFMALFGLGWAALGLALLASGQGPASARSSARAGHA